jgi:hypothetical protein
VKHVPARDCFIDTGKLPISVGLKSVDTHTKLYLRLHFTDISYLFDLAQIRHLSSVSTSVFARQLPAKESF